MHKTFDSVQQHGSVRATVHESVVCMHLRVRVRASVSVSVSDGGCMGSHIVNLGKAPVCLREEVLNWGIDDAREQAVAKSLEERRKEENNAERGRFRALID